MSTQQDSVRGSAYRGTPENNQEMHIYAAGRAGTSWDERSMLPSLANPEGCGMDKGPAARHTNTKPEDKRGRHPRPSGKNVHSQKNTIKPCSKYKDPNPHRKQHSQNRRKTPVSGSPERPEATAARAGAAHTRSHNMHEAGKQRHTTKAASIPSTCQELRVQEHNDIGAAI